MTSDPDAFLDHVQGSRADALALAASDVEGAVTPVYDLNVASTLLNLGHGRDLILKVLGHVPEAIRGRLEAEEEVTAAEAIRPTPAGPAPQPPDTCGEPRRG